MTFSNRPWQGRYGIVRRSQAAGTRAASRSASSCGLMINRLAGYRDGSSYHTPVLKSPRDVILKMKESDSVWDVCLHGSSPNKDGTLHNDQYASARGNALGLQPATALAV